LLEHLHDGGGVNGAGPGGGSVVANGVDPEGGGAIVAVGMAALGEPSFRDGIRRAIEETVASERSIAQSFGAPPGSFARYVAKQAWRRPPGAPVKVGGVAKGSRRLAASIADAGGVMARLLRAVDRQIGKIETRLARKGAVIEEKDARILTHLAKTLHTLMALERDDGATAKEPEPVDREGMDTELARRIRDWAEGREGSE
jgi:hypothetical protein